MQRIARTWFDHLSIRSKGLILLAIPCLYMVVVLSSFTVFFGAYRAAEDLASRSEQRILELTNFEARLFQFAALGPGPSTQIATQRARAIEDVYREMGSTLGQMEGLLRDSPTSSKALDQLRSSVKLLYSQLKREDANYAAEKALNDLEFPSSLTNTVDSLHRSLGELLHDEVARSAERRATVRRKGEVASQLAVGSFASALLVAVAMWQLFSRSVSHRIGAMRSNLTRIESGEDPIPLSASSDEIGELDEALSRITRALRSKSRENQLFVYSVSHDLRSPLVNLQGFSKELELLSNELQAEIPTPSLDGSSSRISTIIHEEIPSTLFFIRSAVQRITSIIDALLKLSRAGRQETKYELIDLAQVVRKIVDSNNSLLKERQTAVKVYPLPTIVSDATSLEQIFGNLLSNAAKYLKPDQKGEIEVGVSATHSNTSGTTFFVRDNGLGIPPNHHNKVFIAFHRLHSEIAPGEGIGLVLVQRAVERLGGRIWFESLPQGGTVFYVYLPTRAELPSISSYSAQRLNRN